MARNGQVTIEGTDTELSKLCDELLEARDTKTAAQSAYQNKESEIAKAMNRAGKKSVKHEGITIRLQHHDAKEKIQIVSAE